MIIQIYQLVDPRDGSVRWVGRTHDMKARLVEHLCNTRGANVAKKEWIRELRSAGLQPVVELIEEVHEYRASERERYWIQFYRAEGEPLLNRGPAGRQSTDVEFLQKIQQFQETGVCSWKDPRRFRSYLKTKHGIRIEQMPTTLKARKP